MIALIFAAHAGCMPTTLSELSQTPGPAVLVLGERKGTQPDLGRAARLVSKLQGTGKPVTIALQAVNQDKQPVLDRFATGALPAESLSDQLDWYGSWGFPYAGYAKLVTASSTGATVLGVGVPLESKPADTPVPIPPGYMTVLADGMAGHFLPGELESPFLQTVTWFDHRIAKAAVEGWSGEGYLVVLADLTHVEGGKGISWQLQRMTDAPVTTVLLGGAGRCFEGDRYL